jgi:hypothetical protein
MGVTGLESVGLTCLAIMSEKIYAIAGGLSLSVVVPPLPHWDLQALPMRLSIPQRAGR